METTKLLVAFFLTGAVATAQAQTITGKLPDENNTPLEYANIVLLAPGDSAFVQGTVTNENGIFTLDKVNETTYILKASSIGYETVFRHCQAGNIGTLVLRQETVELQETTITAHRPTYKMKGDALVTDVSNSLLSTVGTANDVLARIPFVQGSDGEFTVFGKGTPLIYLNGRLLRDLDELERLSSKDIQHVEVITNPGSEYDVTVKSVIKIKTVKPQGEGFSINAMAGFTQNHHFNHNEQLNLNYRHGGLDMFANLYYSKGSGHQEQRSKQHVETDTIWDHHSKTNVDGTSQYINVEGGFNYMVNADHSFGARYTFARTPRIPMNILSAYEIVANGLFYDRQQYDFDYCTNNFSHRVNAYYLGNVGKLGIDFNADYYSGELRTNQNVEETSEAYSGRYVTTSNLDDNLLYAAKLVLTYPIGKGELKVGTEYSHTRRINRYENPQNYLPETDNKIVEDKVAAFAQFAIALGKLQASGGLRYEHVVSDYFDKEILVDEQSRDYGNLYPNLSLSLPVGKTQLSLSYTAKTRRPSYSELSSNIQYDDHFTYEGGNPNLKPENIHDITFMANYRWIQFLASYQQYRDAIESVAKSYEENSAITLYTIENFHKVEMWNAGLVLSPKIAFWEPTFSLQVHKQNFKNITLEGWKKFDHPRITTSLDNNFRISKTCHATLSLYWNGKGHNGISLDKPDKGMDIGIYKSFAGDKLSMDLKINDVFASRRSSSITYGEHIQLDNWNYSDTRNIRFTVRYKFNATRSKYLGTGAANEEMNRL